MLRIIEIVECPRTANPKVLRIIEIVENVLIPPPYNAPSEKCTLNPFHQASSSG